MEHVEDDLPQPDLAHWPGPAGEENYRTDGRLKKRYYEKELARLQAELVQLQHWVQRKGLRVLIIFEGRGSAGKGIDKALRRLGGTPAGAPRTFRVHGKWDGLAEGEAERARAWGAELARSRG